MIIVKKSAVENEMRCDEKKNANISKAKRHWNNVVKKTQPTIAFTRVKKHE